MPTLLAAAPAAATPALLSSLRLDRFAEAHGFGEEALGLMRGALRAAAARDDERAARGLLCHGCPPDNQLLYALVRRRRAPGVVRELLRYGADPNTTDALQTHVLTLATMHGDVTTARRLLRAGADPLIEEDGESILSLARNQGTASGALVALMERAIVSRGGAVPAPPSMKTRSSARKSRSR